MKQVHIFQTNELAIKLAEYITASINTVLQHKPVFTIAISGGETPKQLYTLLAQELFLTQIDWKKIKVFWGDERFVPFDHKENNAKMAFDTLLSHVPIPAENIYRIDTISSPQIAAEEYENILRTLFKMPETFDLVLLGMGDDGHTLSIFPGESFNVNKWVDAVYLKSKEQWRISLTPGLVNRSSKIIFMVSGDKKANVLKKVLENTNKNQFPAQLIRPLNGNLHWFIDENAGFLLEK